MICLLPFSVHAQVFQILKRKSIKGCYVLKGENTSIPPRIVAMNQNQYHALRIKIKKIVAEYTKL